MIKFQPLDEQSAANISISEIPSGMASTILHGNRSQGIEKKLLYEHFGVATSIIL